MSNIGFALRAFSKKSVYILYAKASSCSVTTSKYNISFKVLTLSNSKNFYNLTSNTEEINTSHQSLGATRIWYYYEIRPNSLILYFTSKITKILQQRKLAFTRVKILLNYIIIIIFYKLCLHFRHFFFKYQRLKFYTSSNFCFTSTTLTQILQFSSTLGISLLLRVKARVTN